jgi:hypothetical protein
MRGKLITSVLSLLLFSGGTLSALAEGHEAGSGTWVSGNLVETSKAPSRYKPVLSTEKVQQGKIATSSEDPIGAKYARAHTRRATSLSEFTGQKVMMSKIYSGSSLYLGGLLVTDTVEVSNPTESTLLIKNFCVSGLNVTANVDVNAGTVSIPYQKVYTISQGDVYLCKYDSHKGVYSVSDPITGTLVGSDILLDDGYGFFLTEGAYTGSYLNIGLMDYGVIATSNTQISNKRVTFSSTPMTTSNRSVVNENTWGYMYQINSSQVRLMHIPSYNGYGSLNINVESSSAITIDPQTMFKTAYTGNFNCYKGTETVSSDGSITISASILSPIEGTYSNGTFKWGSWIQANTSSGISSIYESTALTSTLAVSAPATPSVNFSGEGTAESPYLIKSIDDLVSLDYAIRNDATLRGTSTSDVFSSEYTPVYSGKYFKLANDLDYSTYKGKVTPIGTSTLRFDGVFDGDNHTISNFSIDDYAYDYCGLFAATGNDSEIKNLTIKDSYIRSLGYTIGALAGKTAGKVDNITVISPTIYATAGYNVGGVMGYAGGAVSNCNVSGIYISSLGYNGGIAGRAYADITNCHVKGRMAMNGSAVFEGGIVGYYGSASKSKYTITDCSFAGLISSTNNDMGLGGIAGGTYNIILKRNTASGYFINTASSSTYVGGLAGAAWQSDFEDCYSSGVVSNPNVESVGGLIGHITTGLSDSEACTFKNCITTATVNASNMTADRVLYGNGDITKVSATNVWYDSQIANLESETTGKKTTELTSGEALKDFSTTVWNFTAGRYPVISSNNDSTSVALASAALILDKEDTVEKVKNNFVLSPATAVDWKGVVNNNFSTNGGYSYDFVKTDSNWTAQLNGKAYTDTIYAFKDGYYKFYTLNVAPLKFEQSGSAEDPYLITNKADLKYLSEVTNNASLTFEGCYVKVTNDIDCEGDTIKPICHDTKMTPTFFFQGSFDGDGHTIHNMKMIGVEKYGENESGNDPDAYNPKSANSVYNIALIGSLGANGVVKNITIAKDCYFEGFDYVGAIAGTSSGLIENCKNYAPVIGAYGYAGGIAGQLLKGSVTRNCFNGGDIKVDASYAGGIAATISNATLENCANAGEVAAVWFNAYQKVGTQNTAGGIVGTATSSTITNVLNVGDVKTHKTIGGIAAKVTGTAAAPCKFTNAVSYSALDSITDYSAAGAVVGSNTLGTYENVIYNAQLQKVGAVANTKVDGVSGLTGKELTKVEVLPDSAWSVEAGVYPTLKTFKDEPQLDLAKKATILFADNNNALYVNKAAELGENVEWKLQKGEAFKIASKQLTVSVPTSGSAQDTIVASLNGYSRSLALQTINASILAGEGTQEAPYLISNADEYLKVSAFVKDNLFDYDGQYLKVTEDLDFSGKTFEPIAYNGIMFNGTLDGDNHTIKNVTYSATEKTDTERGLFGSIGADGVVKNLVLDASNSITAYSKVGGLTGNLYGEVDNIINNGSVTSTTTYTGGIAGYAYPNAVIKNSKNNGKVTSTTSYAGGLLGATAAQAKITIENAVNTGVVSGTIKIGGIVGSASAYINHAENSGTVTASTNYAAGVIAEALLPSGITNGTNSGKLSAPQYLAGIVAYSATHTAATPFVVDSCSNTVDITPGTKGYTGGIAGNILAGATIKNSYNIGKIVNTGTSVGSVGGIVSRLTSTVGAPSAIYDSYNTGTITGGNIVGGIAGYQTGDSCHIERCYNIADVTSTNTSNAYAGGIAGQGPTHLYDTWNAGNVTSKAKYTGGLIGYNTGKGIWMRRCFNVGDVTSTGDYVAGLLSYGRHWIYDCYNFGNVKGANVVAGLFGAPGTASAEIYHIYVGRNYNAGKVTGTGANVANVIGQNDGCKVLTVETNYYDSDVNGELASDKLYEAVKGLPKAELIKTDISDDFELGVATYPSLKVFKDNLDNSFAVATILLAEGETTDSVASSFLIGQPQGAVWTASSNLVIDGNTVTLKNSEPTEEATLTLTVGEKSRTYNLTLKREASGVNSLNADGKTVLRKVYYSINGTVVSEDAINQTVVIEKTEYTDGTWTTRKYVPKR